ncbi:hypothetical protein HELRODRAFT_160132 [Helobdella robusta]|uniref:Uncharacterized protein n=1 Tax=Helobdella robusta TaxID=6412 RepID=T1EPU7_HELRO|nr:hypothetical protein HELRODRAFT_160132 [Helobdella robusta]ESO06019.1 hypothetical protein HELRODRAFT_160132 [Helobdella robusta]
MASFLSTSATRSSRQKDKIYLIGFVTHQITGGKLPSNRQVLRSLFYNIREVKLNIKGAARLTIKKVFIFWEKARIQTKHLKDSVAKLEKLHEEWRKLQKNSNRTGPAQTEKEKLFKAILDDLFDIAHQDALQTATEEDKLFLLKQREKGCPGVMGGVDLKCVKAEERWQKRNASEMTRLTKFRTSSELEELKSLGSSTSDEDEIEDNDQRTEKVDMVTLNYGPEKKMKKYTRGTEEIVNEKLFLILDRCAISDRDAARIISATIESLSHDSQQYIVKLEGAVVHWGGKLLPDMLNKENVERVAVLISCGEEEQLIGVPLLENGAGSTIAKSVYSELGKWGALDKIQAMSFDTTAVNTGRIKGACVLLEQLMEKKLLYLPCRHQILEVVLRSVFDAALGKTTGPQSDIFKKFKTEWNSIDKKKFKSGVKDKSVASKLINPDQISKLWSNNEKYLKSKKIVDGLKVTNDTAKRGVKLITDYNSCITKDEEQKQYLLQLIAECRTKFPGFSKASLSEPLPFEQTMS